MSITYKDVSRLPGLQISLSILVLGMVLLLTGCIAGVPLKTEKPSDHFDLKYVETHQRSTKQEVVEELGGPEVIFRSKDKTYYVYDATGDTRMIVGAVFIVPPFFVPFWTPKEEGDALHCLALIFDERGLLQDYVAATASEEAWGGLLLPPEPGAWPWWGEVTECGKVLWNEKELAQLDLVAHQEETRSLETATPSDRLSLWAYSVFGNTTDGYDWLCRAADQGGMESRVQLGNLFYNESHRFRDNLIQAYVWYSLANTADNSVLEKRLMILKEVLSYAELQEARHRLESWKPNECMKALNEGGLLNNRKSEENLEAAIEPEPRTSDLETFAGKDHNQIRRMAEQGDAKAMLQLFWSIRGPERLIWLCRGADRGYADAQYRLGFLYRHGKTGSLPKDIARAHMWYRLAAKNGHIWAEAEADELAARMESTQLASAEALMAEWEPKQCERSVLVYYSTDRQRDIQERRKHYEESGLPIAVEAGDAQSQWQAYKMLGNTPDGYKWLCRAADQGYISAQMQLGYLYGAGPFGFEQDYTRSYLWYRLAGSGELREAVEKAIKKVEKRPLGCTEGEACYIAERIVGLRGLLGTGGVSRAEQLVRGWKPGQCELELVPAELLRSEH